MEWRFKKWKWKPWSSEAVLTQENTVLLPNLKRATAPIRKNLLEQPTPAVFPWHYRWTYQKLDLILNLSIPGQKSPFDVSDDGPAIAGMTLITEADVPDIDEETFQEFANGAKEGCPVSKALSGVDISLDATLH